MLCVEKNNIQTIHVYLHSSVQKLFYNYLFILVILLFKEILINPQTPTYYVSSPRPLDGRGSVVVTQRTFTAFLLSLSLRRRCSGGFCGGYGRGVRACSSSPQPPLLNRASAEVGKSRKLWKIYVQTSCLCEMISEHPSCSN